ncbi:MAG: hypothetical protein ACLQGU_11540 [bacterium]
METIWGALIGAIIGSMLIIINEWVKIYSGGKKTRRKFKIWVALEQKGVTAPSLTVEQVSAATGLCAKEVELLLYEMIQDGAVKEGPLPKVFTRYLRDFSRTPVSVS